MRLLKNQNYFNLILPKNEVWNLVFSKRLCTFATDTKRIKMMKRSWLLSLLCLCSLLASADNVRSLYQTLDSLIAHYSEMTTEKENRIRNMKDGVKGMTLTDEQIYDQNLRLYDEYVAFMFDSAFYYVEKNVERLRHSDDHNRFAASAVRMAHILSVTGLFDRARRLLDEIDPEKLDGEQRVAYYNQQSELNLYRSEMAQFTPYFHDYIQRAQYYRQLIIQTAPKDSFDYLFSLATYTCETGNPDKAIQMMEAYLPKLSVSTRVYSIVTSTLAYFYQCKDDKDRQEYYLLLSAISDERGAIRENNSLRSLSEILMARGENDNAYRYLYQSITEAQFYGSRLRMMQVGRMAPQVMKLYDTERTQTQQHTYIYLGIISFISLVLLGIMAYTLVLLRKKKAASRQIEAMNKALTAHNEQIQATNRQMKEANRIKDEYIGRFLELSSNLIKQGEERNKHLNRLARDRKLEELYTELKSSQTTNSGIRMFHQNFDEAFLNIYPDFISEVNRLLVPDEAFVLSEGDSKRLTTELRILALIRLGISDNQEIADILRSSITTIYTYRSKLKSRAVNKDSFEDDVRKISTY